MLITYRNSESISANFFHFNHEAHNLLNRAKSGHVRHGHGSLLYFY